MTRTKMDINLLQLLRPGNQKASFKLEPLVKSVISLHIPRLNGLSAVSHCKYVFFFVKLYSLFCYINASIKIIFWKRLQHSRQNVKLQ